MIDIQFLLYENNALFLWILTMLKRITIIIGLTALLLGCQPTMQYERYEGSKAIHYGKGGTVKTVDGVDFWSDGAPPRKYKVIGVIKDQRWANSFSLYRLDKNVASQVKEVGGDAVLIASNEQIITGYRIKHQGQFNPYSNSYSQTDTQQQLVKNLSVFIVIKYLK